MFPSYFAEFKILCDMILINIVKTRSKTFKPSFCIWKLEQHTTCSTLLRMLSALQFLPLQIYGLAESKRPGMSLKWTYPAHQLCASFDYNLWIFRMVPIRHEKQSGPTFQNEKPLCTLQELYSQDFGAKV